MNSLPYMQEKYLARPLRTLFPISHYKYFSNVRINDRQIDAIFQDRKSASTFAVEMKIKNWKRALEQAAVYQLFTKNVYIAIWHRYWNQERIPLFRRYGIGVILVEKRGRKLMARRVLGASKGIGINRFYANKLSRILEGEN